MNTNLLVFIFVICYSILTIYNIPNIKNRLPYDVYLILMIGIFTIMMINFCLYKNNIKFINILHMFCLTFICVDMFENYLYYEKSENDFFGGQGKKYMELVTKTVDNEELDMY